MKYLYTGDNHFDHENIVWMNNRPVKDVEEMNEEMIRRWNAKVNSNDVVYILGDLFYRSSNPERILKRLKGRKRIILGNHDGSWISKVNMDDYFEEVHTLGTEISDGKRAMTLCHYPLLTWKHAKKNYMIHGHIHNDTSSDYWPLIKVRDRVLNAGADINNFEPVTFEELLENNIKFKEEH